MKKTTTPIDRALVWAREMRMNQSELARTLGVRPQDITNWKTRGVPPQWHAGLAKVLGRSVDELLGLASKQAGKTGPIRLVDNPDFPAIRRVQFKLSAGASGFAVDYIEDDDAPIVLRRQWFEARGYDPAKLFAVRAPDASMEPGLYSGDTVVVNTEDTTASDGEVYAINYEGELVIKRLVRDAGRWWLVSDNPDPRRYPRKVCDERVFLLGRIVHKQSERI